MLREWSSQKLSTIKYFNYMHQKSGISTVGWICKTFHWRLSIYVKRYTVMDLRKILHKIESITFSLIPFISIYSASNSSQTTPSKRSKSIKTPQKDHPSPIPTKDTNSS
jgi:hypothetical protein